MRRLLDETGQTLAGLGRLLTSMSYQSVLSRGYAVVRDADNRPVMSATGNAPGDTLSLEFQDGRTDVMVTESVAPTPKKAPARKKAKPKKPPTEQGDLF